MRPPDRAVGARGPSATSASAAPAASAAAAAASAFGTVESPRPATCTAWRSPPRDEVEGEAALAERGDALGAHVGVRGRGRSASTRARRARAAARARAGRRRSARRSPSGPSAATRSPFSRAIASREPRCSMCAVPTFVITPTVGCAIAASGAISPRWFMPISTTSVRCAASRSSSVSGRPIVVVQVAAVLEAGRRAPPRIAAHISLVVVLPLLPVIATTGPAKPARCPAASAPSAQRGVGARRSPRRGAPAGTASGALHQQARRAGRRAPAPRKACASWRGAADQRTKSLPGEIAARVGRDAVEARARRAPRTSRAAGPARRRRRRGTGITRRTPRGARGAPPRGRRTGSRSRPTIW